MYIWYIKQNRINKQGGETMSKKVFLTGATGGMGRQTMLKMLENPEEIRIKVLARDCEEDQKILAEYRDRIEVVWGDLQDFDLLREAVADADYVFHIGAIVNPFSTDFPAEHVLKVNYGSTLAMLQGIKEAGHKDSTRFIYIGTVEMTGERMAPVHWGRVGDPLKPSVYSYYAMSKVYSERAVAESGLKYWASLRQSYMEPVNPAAGAYPIGGEMSMNSPAEHMDAESSGNLLRNIVLGVPDEFWNRAYNMGAGEDARVTNLEWSEMLGLGPFDGFRPKWKALHNFHGHWFLDSDELEALVPYRMQTAKDMIRSNQELFAALFADIPPEMIPTPEQTMTNNEALLSKAGGMIDIIRRNDVDAIAVWFGSKARYDSLPDTWEEMHFEAPSREKSYLDHGYDENKAVSELDIEDMKKAAAFRGGKCLSEDMEKGDLMQELTWECAFGHRFTAKPNTVLKLGHWCPHCMNGRWNYTEQARKNPFFRQVWAPLHPDTEDEVDIAMESDAQAVEKLFR
jgi:hypothetical protein